MKKTKLQKGITLIALIITIIILLVLAVVTIGAVKDSGIITYAQNASNDYTIAQEKEQIGLAYSEYKIGKYAGSKDTFESIFANSGIEGTVSGDDKSGYTIVIDERVYVIAPDGTISQETAIPWDGTTKTEVAELDNTYLISNAAELAWFAEQVNSGNLFEGKTVKLTNDINLANKEWTPIGTITSTGAYNLFGGTTGATFDGNGHVIKNIKVTNCSLPAVGLFAAIQQGTIQNLGIESGTIEGLGAEDSSNAATMCSMIGGILGTSMGNVTISRCYNDSVNLKYTSERQYNSGGIVGANSMGNLTINNCYNTAANLDDGEGMTRFGGILSDNSDGSTVTISNCYNIGNVTGDNSSCTGIYNYNGGTIEVTNCYTVPSYDQHVLATHSEITITTREAIQEMIDNINT